MANAKFRFHFNLKSRMLFLILSTTIIIFIIAIGYIGISSRNMAYKSAKQNANIIASQSALRLENQLNASMDAIRTLAQSFSKWEMWPDTLWATYVQQMYLPVFQNNPQIYKLWDSWEKNMIDKNYHTPHGRYTHTYYRLNGKTQLSVMDRSLDGDPPLYAKIKKEARESIWEPYWDVFTETGASKFMTSMSVPIKKEEKYVGIVAVDITMDELQNIVSAINPMRESYAFLISNEGVLISHPDTAAIGKAISEIMPELDIHYDITNQIKTGKQLAFRDLDLHSQKEVYMSFSPIKIGQTGTPWSVALSIPVNIITEEANNNLLISIVVTGIGLILLTFLTYIIAIRISNPISRSTLMLKKIEEGDIHNIDEIHTNRLDEIGEMAKSLNAVASGLNKTAGFAEEIGKGNLDSEFNPKSEKDVLGNALIEMRASLRKAHQEENQRKKEDAIQRWVTNGLAKFGEILRQDNNNLNQLSFNVIKNLVDYLEANQGAIFVLNDKDKDNIFFELQAAVAYDRRRYLKKHIRIGEDLVGRAAHEKQSIYLLDIPQDYIQITSGMGTANPNTLLIVPVLLNDVVFGVLEIASFNKIEKHQIEFVEKIGESIASTLNAVKVNQRTQQLLEDSQHQREELSSQDEEMRQNLEELQATQEEAARREFELRGFISALSASTYTVEYDLFGTIIDVNEQFAKLVGLTKEQMIGMSHKDGIEFTPQAKEQYERFWEDLRHGVSKYDVNKIEFNEKQIYLQETYTPIIDEDEKPYKILKIGFDITKLKDTEKNLEKALKNLDSITKLTEQQTEELEKLKADLNTEKAKNLKIETAIQQLQDEMAEKAPTNKDVKPDNNFVLPKKGQNLIEFTEDMATEITEMDDQHRKIITLLNNLYNDFTTNKTKKAIKENLRTLIDYAAWHFNNEEGYFDEFEFENSTEHKIEHDKFVKSLNDFISKYEQHTEMLNPQWFVKTKMWIETHFRERDVQYAPLLKSKGLK